MKRLVAIAGILILAVLLLPIPGIYAQSDNLTWVASDNFTITIEDFNQIMTGAAEAHAEIIAENQTAMLTNAIGLVLVLVITVLAYCRKPPLRMLYILSGLSLIVYGFNYFSTSIYLSIIIVVMGIVSFVMAIWGRDV